MSIAGLIAALLLTSLVVLVIALPLIMHRADGDADERTQKRRDRITVYYERVLRNLHDLDEDFALGKLDADDYGRDRALWLERGAAALRALDELNATSPAAALFGVGESDDGQIDDAAVEAAIRAYRQKQEQHEG
ncbi:MAG: hypothetical protein SGI73_21900 [Chloroflexota bacterium]|nr:hypothetical protein [Chloroflexota bacterium]